METSRAERAGLLASSSSREDEDEVDGWRSRV